MISIKCIVMNTNYKYKFIVKLYNRENKIIDEFYVINGEEIKINNNNGGKIIIINKNLYPTAIMKVINNHNLTFNFYEYYNVRRKVTFYLRDSLYKNLIIEKGEIKLWPNHI